MMVLLSKCPTVKFRPRYPCYGGAITICPFRCYFCRSGVEYIERNTPVAAEGILVVARVSTVVEGVLRGFT